MTKVLTWNVGSWSFLQYAKHFHLSYKNQKIVHEYFQSRINGTMISSFIKKTDPDIFFLQEIADLHTDLQNIKILKNYPYREFARSSHELHHILIASKKPLTKNTKKHFIIVRQKDDDVFYVPVHLNTFSSHSRAKDITTLTQLTHKYPKLIIAGDTNIFRARRRFLLRKDKKTYRHITATMKDATHSIVSTTAFGLMLDRVFHSSTITIKNAHSPRVRGRFMDHYPVVFTAS